MLAGLHLGVKAGELVVVVGGVGSGKSSLLLAALGELEPVPLPPRLGPTGRPRRETRVKGARTTSRAAAVASARAQAG